MSQRDVERRESRQESWQGARVCVAGLGVSGTPAARALAALGADVTAVDARDSDQTRAAAAELRNLGATVRLGTAEADQALPAHTRLVVTSPGWPPDAPLLRAAGDAGVPVIGDVELAWRLRHRGSRQGSREPAPWLALTGTNGKTSTVRMLESILLAAGHRARAVGNVGASLLDAVLDGPESDVLAIELSSFQLHWSRSLDPHAAAVLNVAPDHLDWHGSWEAYAADKGRIYGPGTLAVSNADDETSTMLAGDRQGQVSFTLGVPGSGQLGVADGTLRDRAFADDAELAAEEDVRPYVPHNVANALAAAALARAYGVPPEAVSTGLRAFRPDPHRIAEVATLGRVRYVDDSKATNPHAAAASLAAYRDVVWIAGGQLKGADVDGLVATHGLRLRAAVVLGQDRAEIRDALTRHAPNIPVREVPEGDTEPMRTAVRVAGALARPGDAVLLAPAGASFDMFASYGARGDAFAAAVRDLQKERL